MRWIITLTLFFTTCQVACAHGFRTSISQPAPYVQPQVVTLGQNDVIAIVGDSVTGRGECPGGWINILRQYVAAYHSQYNFQFLNAGYAYLSSTVLNYPGTGIGSWNTNVVAKAPTVIFIWIGIDDILVNHGVTTAGPWDMAGYGQNLQAIINAARQIPTVRQIVLVTPLCAGERYYGQNPQDPYLNQVIAVIQQTSINNNIPVLNMRAMAISAEYAYNRGDFPQGVLTGDGIHPYTNPSVYPGDRVSFLSPLMESLIAGEFIKGCGM